MNRLPFKRDSANGDQTKPFKKTYQCSRFLCAYRNPPQAAAGTYVCHAVYAGKSCTGTYEISEDDAGEYHATWRLRYREQEEQKKQEEQRLDEDDAYEERMRYVRELRKRKDEDSIKRWKEECAMYERILFSGETYDSAEVNEYFKSIGKGPIIDPKEQGQRVAQMAWMENRMGELSGMIADLEALKRRDEFGD